MRLRLLIAALTPVSCCAIAPSGCSATASGTMSLAQACPVVVKILQNDQNSFSDTADQVSSLDLDTDAKAVLDPFANAYDAAGASISGYPDAATAMPRAADELQAVLDSCEPWAPL